MNLKEAKNQLKRARRMRKKGRDDEAIYLFLEIANEYEHHYENRTPEEKELLAIAYGFLARTGRNSRKIIGYRSRQIEIIEELKDLGVTALDLEDDLANAYLSLGNEYSKRRERKTSINAYRNAIAIFKDLHYSDGLFYSYSGLAAECEREGDAYNSMVNSVLAIVNLAEFVGMERMKPKEMRELAREFDALAFRFLKYEASAELKLRIVKEWKKIDAKLKILTGNRIFEALSVLLLSILSKDKKYAAVMRYNSIKTYYEWFKIMRKHPPQGTLKVYVIYFRRLLERVLDEPEMRKHLENNLDEITAIKQEVDAYCGEYGLKRL